MTLPILIVGGGFAGLFAAWLLSEMFPKQEITLIEASPQLGGLLQSSHLGSYTFDHGAHNISETGISEIDVYLNNLLLNINKPWQKLSGPNRDLAGSFIAGLLQTHTQYPDLCSLNSDDYQFLIGDFFKNLQQDKNELNQESAKDVAYFRFGSHISNRFILPVLEKTYKTPANQLHPLSLKLIPLDRIVLFNSELTLDLMNSKCLKEILAFPDQRHLPPKYTSGLSSFYPSQPGIFQLINLIVQKLNERNIKIHTKTTVNTLQQKNKNILSVELINGEGQTFPLKCSKIFWTAGLPSLYQKLNLPPITAAQDAPLTTALCHFSWKKKPKMDDLYYFYCHDHHYDIFRLCCYTNYCSSLQEKQIYTTSIEVIVDIPSLNKEELILQTIENLNQMGIVEGMPLFSHLEILPRGFPRPSLNNFKIFDLWRAEILSTKHENIHLLGIMAEKDLFFQRQIMIHTFKTFNKVLN